MAEPHIGRSSFGGQDGDYLSGSLFGSRGFPVPASQGGLHASAGWKNLTVWRTRKSGSLRQPLRVELHPESASNAPTESQMLSAAAGDAIIQGTAVTSLDLEPPDTYHHVQNGMAVTHRTGAGCSEPHHATLKPLKAV